MTRPFRLQLSRRKGFNLQEHSRAVNGLPAVNVALFRHDIETRLASVSLRGFTRAALEELRGKNLACWCKPGAPCHADVLLELANRPICEALP
jgi:hypothetical protein